MSEAESSGLPLLADDLLATMAACGETRRFEAGEVFIHEGDPSQHCFILLEGRVKVFSVGPAGREVIYNILGPGEFFGEMGLDGGFRSASVMAMEPTTCVVVSNQELRDFMAAYPDFALLLVQKLIQRVRHATEHVRTLAFDDVYHRTARLLQALARPERDRWVVAEPLTQQEIAGRVGATREMINRIFRHLRKAGYIALQGRRIVLLKPLPDRW
ncbi:MAG TPA: Crp/Fnr family transcriptional regulator [Arenimonas sp.]|nr:Crp/Fnr family transcriptional regulator [Arenimonas sp.]